MDCIEISERDYGRRDGYLKPDVDVLLREQKRDCVPSSNGLVHLRMK